MSTNQEKLNEQLFSVIVNTKDSEEAKLKKLKYLVYLGADVNTKLYGKSVLSKAIEQNAGVEVQNFLREKGAKEGVISKKEAERLGKQFWDDKGELKSQEEIKELIKKGADVNAKGKNGQTALMVAANWGKLDVVKCLVEHGADLEAKDKYGNTALFGAAINGQLDVVKCLAKNGADLDVKDNFGETVLMNATRDGNLDMVKYLAKNGADLDAKDNYERTALDIARKWEKADCVEFLEEAQKKNSARKNQGDKTSGSQIVKANEGR